MDLDLPPPQPVHIHFCGRPAITTGVVNLQILFGELNYYLVQRVDEKNIDFSGDQSLEPTPQGEVPKSDSRFLFTLCSQDGLPFGSFRVEEGGDYWIANGTQYREGVTQGPIPRMSSVEDAKMQKEDTQRERDLHECSEDPASDSTKKKKLSRKRHKDEKHSVDLEGNPIASTELSGDFSDMVPRTHSHRSKHRRKSENAQRSDSPNHKDAKTDLVDPATVIEEPLPGKTLPNLLQEQDNRNNLIKEVMPSPSQAPTDFQKTPRVEEGSDYCVTPHEGEELIPGEGVRTSGKGKTSRTSKPHRSKIDEQRASSNDINDTNARAQRREWQSADCLPPHALQYKHSGEEPTAESLKKSMMSHREQNKYLGSPSLSTNACRNSPKPSELSLQKGRPSPPAESPMLGLSQLPTTIVEEFILDASVNSSYAGSEYLYNE